MNFANDKASIRTEILKLREELNDVPNDLRWLTGEYFNEYLDDMKIVQMYANDNRHAMLRVICEEMGWKHKDEINTIHNCIDVDKMILRKGAVSAAKGELLLIPANMRDGMLVCEGKGNPDWNCSAPHGAGRLKSRSNAKRDISLEDFKKSMVGIFTTSVNSSTLDESPQAYKPIETLYNNITPTVDILSNPRPLYNFKASEEKPNWKELKQAKKEEATC